MIFASSNAATAVVTLVIAAVLSRVFDKIDYATYRQTLLVYQFSGPLLALGLPAALFYFLPGETSRIRAVLLENLILLGVLGGSFSLFLVLGGNVFIAEQFSNPELEETLLVFALYPVLFLPTTAVSAVLVVQEKVQWLFLHTVVTRLSRLFLVLGVVWLCAAGP
ncbi:MAG: oligosaccharide flippase family protein, partial [Roseibacillus sp.]